MNQLVTGGTGYPGPAVTTALASPNDATSGSFGAAFPDVALCSLAGSGRTLAYIGGPEPALLYAGNGKHRSASVHRDDIATLYAPGVRTAPARPRCPGVGAHSPAMSHLATMASCSHRPDGRIAAEPGSRARLVLFLATFMPLPGITAVNTALPSTHGEES